MSSFEFDPSAALKRIEAQLVAGANAAATDLAGRAREKAPVRKARKDAKEPGLRGETFPIGLKPISAFKTREERIARRELFTGERFPSIEEARFYRFTAGPFKGETPDSIHQTRRGGIAGGGVAPERVKGGGLRRGIHAVEAAIDGRRVVAQVRSEAPYSAAIEKGFHHHPDGKFIEGRPFLRPSSEEIRDDWNKGTYIRKG